MKYPPVYRIDNSSCKEGKKHIIVNEKRLGQCLWENCQAAGSMWSDNYCENCFTTYIKCKKLNCRVKRGNDGFCWEHSLAQCEFGRRVLAAEQRNDCST